MTHRANLHCPPTSDLGGRQNKQVERGVPRRQDKARRTLTRQLFEGDELENRSIMTRIAGGAALLAGLGVLPAQAHHSFAMYDQTQTLPLTGVVYQFVAQPGSSGSTWVVG